MPLGQAKHFPPSIVSLSAGNPISPIQTNDTPVLFCPTCQKPGREACLLRPQPRNGREGGLCQESRNTPSLLLLLLLDLTDIDNH